MNTITDRRSFIHGLGLLGCSAAAFPMTTTVSFASGKTENRLVVIILRGAMDGLDVVRPIGDPAFAKLRPDLKEGSLPLDGYFALHPGLRELIPLWKKGELAFAHAVSTPYRDKRSHFDGQDLLEAGTGFDVGPSAIRDGWLNRLLQEMPNIQGETAYAVGREKLQILSGRAPSSSWAPETQFELSDQAQALLAAIYAHDPLFADAANEAVQISNTIDQEGGRRRGSSEKRLAEFAAARLNEDTRIATFSVSGWDTHRNQAGAMNAQMRKMTEVILTLKSELGGNWGNTTVLAMTEFGRTAAQNGSKGTDHGTGGAMLMAGGAVRGGKIYGTWPGLAEVDLYDRRDLMPTTDVRAFAGWAMHAMAGISKGKIERSIFPGLELGDDPGILL